MTTFKNSTRVGLLGLSLLGAGWIAGCVEIPISDSVTPPTGRDMATVNPPDLAVSGPHWRWESPKPQGNNLRSVWGVPGASTELDQLYIGGDSGTILIGGNAGWSMPRSGIGDSRSVLAVTGQGSGSQALVLGVGVYDLALIQQSANWRDLNPLLGTGDGSLNAAWATPTPGTFFVVGSAGRIFQVVSNGTSFQPEGKGVTTDALFGVTGAGSGSNLDVYAVGANGRIVHRQAGIWTVENTLFTQQLNSVFMASTGEVFAVGDSGTVLRRQAGSWQSETVPTSVQLTAVWGAADEIYAVGARGTILRRKAGVWGPPEAPTLTGELLSALWGTVRGAEITVYAVGNSGTILRRDRGNWTAISSRVTQSSLAAIWVRSASELYAVGSGGAVVRRSGSADQGTWSEPAKGLTTASLNAVTGYSPSMTGEADVYAVGADGTILHKPALTWDIEGVALTSQELTGVAHSGGSPYVVGLGGVVAKKVGPNWTPDLPTLSGMPVTSDLYAAWTTGQGTAQVTYVVGAGGMILRRDNLGWTREASGLTTESLTALFGTNDQSLYAFGAKGATLKRSGGAWKLEPVKQFTGGARGSAGCVINGTSELLAVGTQGLILRRSGTDWVNEPSLTGQPFSGIGAANANDIYAIGSGGLVLHKY